MSARDDHRSEGHLLKRGHRLGRQGRELAMALAARAPKTRPSSSELEGQAVGPVYARARALSPQAYSRATEVAPDRSVSTAGPWRNGPPGLTGIGVLEGLEATLLAFRQNPREALAGPLLADGAKVQEDEGLTGELGLGQHRRGRLHRAGPTPAARDSGP